MTGSQISYVTSETKFCDAAGKIIRTFFFGGLNEHLQDPPAVIHASGQLAASLVCCFE
jgi:hypothetical protein